MGSNQHKPYTKDQIKFLRDNYSKMSGKKLTAAFNENFKSNRTVGAITGTCKREGIKSGRNGQFAKGTQPWNTGTKGVCKANSGSFTGNSRPDNKVPIGHQRVDAKNGYIWEKVEHPNKFRLKHQLVWEEQNGKIPDGMVLWFIDGNRQNCVISNLELIKKTEQLRRNKLRVNQSPEEIQETLKLVAKTQVVISERKQELLR
ncbi:MAG: HNH endonuclease [Hydrogenovibrio crunogenus]|nr:HNH endonuclease [Hydrogenovibrio crunogenus]